MYLFTAATRALTLFAQVVLIALLLTSISYAQTGTIPTLVAPVNGQTIRLGVPTTYQITVSNQSGDPYIYFFFVQRGASPDPTTDLALRSPVALTEALTGVPISWPDSLGTGTFQVYSYARPTSTTAGANISNVVSVNVVTPPDTQPDPFSFFPQSGVARSTTCTSAPTGSGPPLSTKSSQVKRVGRPGQKSVSITGINAATAVSVSGAAGSEISIDGGPWVTSGTILNNQNLTVRHTTSSGFNAPTTSTVSVGGTTADFTCTTEVEDTQPDQFNFLSKTNQSTNTLCVSDPVRLSGFNSAATVSVDGGGELLSSSGAWLASLTAPPASELIVRQRTSTAPSTSTTVNVTTGNVTAPFTCTTAAAAGGSVTLESPANGSSFALGTPINLRAISTLNVLPDSVTFLVARGPTPDPNTDTGIARATNVSLTSATATTNWPAALGAGTFQVYAVWNANTVSTTLPPLSVNSAPNTVTITPAPDTTPDAFSFPNKSDAALGSVCTSAAQTILGINAATPVTVTGAAGSEVSVNGGTFAASANILNNQTLTVRHTASSTNSTATVSSVNVGGVIASFTCTTVASNVDTTPDPFTIPAKANQATDSLCTSDAIVITGIGGVTPISVDGSGEVLQSGTVWSNNTTIVPGPGVFVRQRTSSAAGSASTVTVNIGGVTAPFTCTTAAVVVDSTPDPFTFTSQTGVALSIGIVSNEITVNGINTSAAISVTNGEFSLNNGAFSSTPVTVAQGTTVRVRHNSAATPGADVVTTLTIGGVSGTFTSVTVGPDTTPDAVVFTPVSGVLASTVIESNVQTITGINVPTLVSITGGELSINGGAYTTTPSGNVTAGTTVRVRHTSASAPGTNITTTLTVGTLQTTFVSTTEGADTTPDVLAFADQLGVEPSTLITSNAQIIRGINTAVSVGVQGGEYAINGGAFTSAASTANNGDSVVVRHTSPSGFTTPTITTLTTGTTSTTFRSVTRAQITTGLPSIRIIDPANNSRFDAPANVFVSVAVSDPSGTAQLQAVRIQAGSFVQNADVTTQNCPGGTAVRCVVYRTVLRQLPTDRYTVSASVDYIVNAQNGSSGAQPVTVIVSTPTVPQPQSVLSDIVLVGTAPRIIPGGNVLMNVKAVDSRGVGIPATVLRWNISDANTKARTQKAACAGSPADVPTTQQITTDASGNAVVTFKASCAAGGRELTINHDVTSGVSKRFQLVGPNQLASDLTLVGYTTSTPLILGATSTLTARVTEGSVPVNGAVTTWTLAPTSAGTVQSPVQTDETGEAKSILTLQSGIAEASLTVCIDTRASTCKTYLIRAAAQAVVVPATATVNAITQQAITAPRVQITQIRDRMLQLRNEQLGGFYNGVGIAFPGGRVGTGDAGAESADKGNDGEKKPVSATTVTKPYSAFMLGDVSLSQKKGQVGFDISTRGMTAGVDYRFSKEWVAGAALGYSRAITELNVGGEQKASSVSGSVFAQWLPANSSYVSIVANTGRGNYKLARITTDQTIARAEPKGQSAAAQVEAGYMWSNGGYRLQPFVRGEYAKATIDPIVESGSAEALYIEKQRVRSNTLSAGLVGDFSVNTSMGVFIPSARLELYRENQRINDNFARLVNGTPVLVALTSDPIDKSYGTFGLNLQWLTGIYGTPISSFFGYEHTFGKTGFKVNRFTLGVKIPL